MKSKIRVNIEILIGLLLVLVSLPNTIKSLAVFLGAIISMKSSAYEFGVIMGALAFPLAFTASGSWLVTSGYRQRKLSKEIKSQEELIK